MQHKENEVRVTVIRFVWRSGLFVVALAIPTVLTLAAYCASDSASYVASAQRFSGTVVSTEKPVYEKHRHDFRPVVEATLPSGETATLRFTGLYRVPGDAVGQPMALLYNPTTKPLVVPDSPLNWIGSIVYGSISLALIMVFGVLWFIGRWIPPAQFKSTITADAVVS